MRHVLCDSPSFCNVFSLTYVLNSASAFAQDFLSFFTSFIFLHLTWLFLHHSRSSSKESFFFFVTWGVHFHFLPFMERVSLLLALPLPLPLSLSLPSLLSLLLSPLLLSLLLLLLSFLLLSPLPPLRLSLSPSL